MMREQIPNTENERIPDLLKGLKRIEAPESFEFGVRARITKGESKESASPLSFLKIAVPTAALAVLAAFLYVSGFMSADIPTVQVVDQTPMPEAVVPAIVDTMEVASKEPDSAANLREVQVASARPNRVNNKARSGSVDRTNPSTGGGYKDQTLNPLTVIKRAIPVQKVLESAGIHAEFQGDRCLANSVSGPAERLGVKRGDVILSVNGVSINPSATFEEGTELKSVRVKRAGRNLKLTF
jgi:hypothetical protein